MMNDVGQRLRSWNRMNRMMLPEFLGFEMNWHNSCCGGGCRCVIAGSGRCVITWTMQNVK